MISESLLHRFTDIRILAAVLSIVLSAWAVFIDDVVNNDGILYLRSAELLGRGEWRTALELYKWPLYSLLISAVSQVTSLSLEHAAQLLNAALIALVVVGFLTLIRDVGGDRKTMIAAAFVILLYPGLNEYRSFVIRDFGYLALYLFSLLLFIRNLRSPHWGFTVGWTGAMLLASLFRIEGFVFLLLLPLLQQLRRATGLSAKVSVFVALAIVSFLLITAAGWWIFAGVALPDPTTIGILYEDITSKLSEKTAAIAGQFPDRYSRDYAHTVLAVTLAVMLLTETLVTLTPLYALLTCHALYRKLIFPVQGIKAIWLWMIVLNLGILAAIVLIRFFLTGRFPLALSLTLMLAVPFSLVALYESWRRNRTKPITENWVFPVVCALIVLMGLAGLYQPTNKAHLKQAGLWVKQHVQVESEFFSNNAVVTFYSGRNSRQRISSYSREQTIDFVNTKKWLDYDYVALRVGSEDDSTFVKQSLKQEPVAKFENRRGNKVVIFRIH